jgi:hypothetical protein
MENHNVADDLKEFKITLTEFLYTYALYTLENISINSELSTSIVLKNCLLYWY